jgi:hypothetical protein
MLFQKTFLLFLVLLVSSVDSQFACTMAAQDDDACVAAVGEDEDHCAWCSLSGFGFCVSETQAETLEQSVPSVDCDRYSGDDDAAPDPAGDDAAATDDGISPPTDDAVPDDFWTCLQAKDEASCGKDAGCTWCMTKVGFGLCMGGPSAESAANSDWFTCATGNTGNKSTLRGTITTQEE